MSAVANPPNGREQEWPSARGVRAVALLDAEPQLGRYIARTDLDQARRAVRAPLVGLPTGPIDIADAFADGVNPFGAIIVSGLVTRELSVLGQPTLRLLGPGDVLHDASLGGDLLPADHVLSAALPTTLAVLDDHLLHSVRRWPRLLQGLFERITDSADATLLQMAISQQPRVEDRLLMLFRMLAERWGRMTNSGVVVPMALTHEALGRLIGARRPTITLALKSLAAAGRLERDGAGTWLLHDLDELGSHDGLHPLTDGNRPRPLDGAAINRDASELPTEAWIG